MIFFDVAAHWHKIYALHLEVLVAYGEDGKVELESVGDDAACYLGRWLHGRGAQFSALPEFDTLRQNHRAFHGVAAEMCRQLQQGDQAAAQSTRLAAFRQSSAAVIAAIDALAGEIDRLEAGVRPLQPAIIAEGETCPLNVVSLGVAELDGQHASLAALARLLMANPTAKISADQIPELLSELTSLVALHFASEEIFMQHAGMPAPQRAQHAEAHRKILEGFRQISRSADQVELIAVSDILPKVGLWFPNHLLDFDYGIKPFTAGTGKPA